MALGVTAASLRIADRVEHGNFEWNKETALDLLDLAGSLAVGAGSVVSLGSKSLNITKLRSAVLISEGVDTGTDLASGVILSTIHYRNIQKIRERTDLSADKKKKLIHREIMAAVASGGLILVGTGGAKKAGAITKSFIRKRISQMHDVLMLMENYKRGHLFKYHAGKSVDFLRKRAFDKTFRGPASTSFYTKETATKAVRQNLYNNAELIEEWLANAQSNPNIKLQYTHDFFVGHGFLTKKSKLYDKLAISEIILKKDSSLDIGFQIVTGYPVIKWKWRMEMENKIKLDVFIYFLECYFVQTFLFADLKNLAYNFRYDELTIRKTDQKIKQFVYELYAMKELNDWQEIKKILKESNQILFDDDKMNEEMINILIYCLEDENFDVNTFKPII